MRDHTKFRREMAKMQCTGWGLQLAKKLVGELSGDELDVIGLVIERLQLGRGVYGEWKAAAEKRDLALESLHEELDDVVYRAMRSIRARASAPAREEAGLSAPVAASSLPGGEVPCAGCRKLVRFTVHFDGGDICLNCCAQALEAVEELASVPAREEAGLSAPVAASSLGGPDAARAPGSGSLPSGEAGEGARTLASGAQLVVAGHDAACGVMGEHLAPVECWVDVGGSG